MSISTVYRIYNLFKETDAVYRIYNLFKETDAVHPKLHCKPRPRTRQMDMRLELYAIGYVLEHQAYTWMRFVIKFKMLQYRFPRVQLVKVWIYSQEISENCTPQITREWK